MAFGHGRWVVDAFGGGFPSNTSSTERRSVVTRQFPLSAWLTGRFLAIPAVLNAPFPRRHFRDQFLFARRRKCLWLRFYRDARWTSPAKKGMISEGSIRLPLMTLKSCNGTA